MPSLEIYDKEDNMVGCFSLTEDIISIGRSGHNHIVLPNSPRISRYHAVLVKCGDGEGKFAIRDLSSTHGVIVGRKRVFQKILKSKDKIFIDDIRLEYKEDSGDENISIVFTNESPDEMFQSLENYSLDVENQKTIFSKLEFHSSVLSSDSKLWVEELNYKAQRTLNNRDILEDALDLLFSNLNMQKGSLGCIFKFDKEREVQCMAQKKMGLQSSFSLSRQVFEELKEGKSFLKGHLLYMPIVKDDGSVIGFLYLSRGPYEPAFHECERGVLSMVCKIVSRVLDQKENDSSGDTEFINWPGGMIGNEQAMESINMVAPLDTNVLILGETGVGKEVATQEIHRLSTRKDGPLIIVDCASIPMNLLESELFGVIKKYPGLHNDEPLPGKFEIADGGTIFLDEIAELPMESQAKILRIVQEKQVRRLGEEISRKVDVRIVAATNRDIKKEMEDGTFRSDLFYRFENTITIQPLRERKFDIPVLAHYFLDLLDDKKSMSTRGFTPQAMRILLSYPWFGNVRELRKCVHDSLIKCHGLINVHHLPEEIRAWMLPVNSTEDEISILDEDPILMDEVEKAHILKIIQRTKGNKEESARLLGISKQTVFNKIKKYNLDHYVEKLRKDK